MLPAPTLSFTIPSIHDQTVLDCRIYHPACLCPTSAGQVAPWRRKAAIVAHPYAPLGGCYDDPVVGEVAGTILALGFVVGTFNFRGAGSSQGRTSWQSKAEQNDYLSFIGFMIYYLHLLDPPDISLLALEEWGMVGLSPVPSQALPRPHQTTIPTPASPPSTAIDLPSLLLAGYSYGAIVTTALPPTVPHCLIPQFQAPSPGSAQAEIRHRAAALAKQENELISQHFDGMLRSIRKSRSGSAEEERGLRSPKLRLPGAVRMGGEEDLRRASHESHRSRSSFTIETPDKVRRSIDRVRSLGRSGSVPLKSSRFRRRADRSLGSSAASGSQPSLETAATGAEEEKGGEAEAEGLQAIPDLAQDLRVAYLLVSPIHGLVQHLATLWSSPSLSAGRFRFTSRSPDSQPDLKFTVDPTLAIFGDDDVFGAKATRRWTEQLARRGGPGTPTTFRGVEVAGAGHFWHDMEALRRLREEVRLFVGGL